MRRPSGPEWSGRGEIGGGAVAVVASRRSRIVATLAVAEVWPSGPRIRRSGPFPAATRPLIAAPPRAGSPTRLPCGSRWSRTIVRLAGWASAVSSGGASGSGVGMPVRKWPGSTNRDVDAEAGDLGGERLAQALRRERARVGERPARHGGSPNTGGDVADVTASLPAQDRRRGPRHVVPAGDPRLEHVTHGAVARLRQAPREPYPALPPTTSMPPNRSSAHRTACRTASSSRRPAPRARVHDREAGCPTDRDTDVTRGCHAAPAGTSRHAENRLVGDSESATTYERRDGPVIRTPRRTGKIWWAILGLNQWPLPCQGSALPLS